MIKLCLDDWTDDINWQILALSTHIEDYFLAYQLNKTLGCRLKDSREPFSITHKKSTALFSCYISLACKKTPLLYLINNQSFNTDNSIGLGGLFADEENQSNYTLLNSLKRWDYLLITNDTPWIEANMNQIKKTNVTSNLFTYNNLNNKEQKVLTILTHDK